MKSIRLQSELSLTNLQKKTKFCDNHIYDINLTVEMFSSVSHHY